MPSAITRPIQRTLQACIAVDDNGEQFVWIILLNHPTNRNSRIWFYHGNSPNGTIFAVIERCHDRRYIETRGPEETIQLIWVLFWQEWPTPPIECGVDYNKNLLVTMANTVLLLLTVHKIAQYHRIFQHLFHFCLTIFD